MTKRVKSYRSSILTIEQTEWLMQKWGTSQTETLTVVVDRVFQQENTRMIKHDDYGTLIIEEPTPIVAAPAVPYDLDATDSEWHDKPITSPAMAIDVIGAGKTLMTQCGPLQVQVTQMYFNEIQVTMWSTVTCTDACNVIEESQVVAYLGVFGSLTDGSWKVYCPRDYDGAPQY